MKEVFYSERPSVFQTYENGEVQYRWDIEEVRITQWKCKEVTINSPIDKDKLTQAVITSIWDSDLEENLLMIIMEGLRQGFLMKKLIKRSI